MEKSMIDELIKWIKNYVDGAKAKGVVIGMSGGKDSLVVAKLCTLAVGKENVLGIIMPNGEMPDENDAVKTCKLLEIRYKIINIKNEFDAIMQSLKDNLPNGEISAVSIQNTPPRLRMTMLYAFAGSLNYLVANTSNLSEAMVGYTTKWGDNVGDFAPLASFTKTEVCQIGNMLNLPNELVNKMPSDGLSGKPDEDNLGFSYNELDSYIRNGQKDKNFALIEKKHNIARHKFEPIKKFENNFENYFNKKIKWFCKIYQ